MKPTRNNTSSDLTKMESDFDCSSNGNEHPTRKKQMANKREREEKKSTGKNQQQYRLHEKTVQNTNEKRITEVSPMTYGKISTVALTGNGNNTLINSRPPQKWMTI